MPSQIEWTDEVWNPITGCTKVSRGCDRCYAERVSKRFGWDFDTVKWHLDRFEKPLHWKKRKMIFVNSMSDMFHKDFPEDGRHKLYNVMRKANWHIYQILTKRSSTMRDYIASRLTPMPLHIWHGVSIEDMDAAVRVKHLQETNSPIRFLSCEPLLGSLKDLNIEGINWVIVGGESGPGARPMEEKWALELRDKCFEQDIPFFFKQWGGVRPKSGGRLLQGKEYNAMPKLGSE